MRTEHSAAELVDLVTAIPGVRGIEPGVASSLRAIDSRLRRLTHIGARHGLLMDDELNSITVELALSYGRPVKQVVEDVQRCLHQIMGGSTTVLVRVQSLPT